MTRRHSKIAQLPRELRDELNRLIEENTESKKILALLAERGHSGITPANLSSWIHGKGRNRSSSGYNDWLQEKQAMTQLQTQQEFALELLGQTPNHSIHEAARLLAASQLAQVINGFDIQQLKDALSAQPEDYARVVNALTKLSRDNLEYEQYRFRVAQQKAKIESELQRASAPGLAPETIQQIEKALNLL